MEYMGLIAFMLVVMNVGLPKKVNNLKADIKKLKKAIRGERQMSEIIRELKGRRCILEIEDWFEGPIECEVIDVDDEWMKINYSEKKKGNVTKLVRIENINEISLI